MAVKCNIFATPVMLIVFEGGDGAGKSTQAALLKNHLDTLNIPASLLKYPDRSLPTGTLIASYLKGESQGVSSQLIDLVLAANIWEVAVQAGNAIRSGHVVIMDRFIHTFLAYSQARGSSSKHVETLMKGMMEPALVIYLKISPRAALSRKTGPLEILETDQFQTKVYEFYQEMVVPNWLVLDGTEAPDTIHSKVVRRILDLFNKSDAR